MKNKYIVQSNKTNLYEEFLKEDDAKKYLEEHSCECPYLEEVVYDDKYGDYLDDPEYIIKTKNIDIEENKDKLVDNNLFNEYSLDKELKKKYIECYKDYCKVIYGDDYNLDEALSKEEYKNDGMGQVFKVMGCPPSKLKKYLNQYIKEKGELK